MKVADQAARRDAMVGSDDGDIGAQQHIVADADACVRCRPDRAVMVDETVVADMDILRKLEEGGGGDLDVAATVNLGLADEISAGDIRQQVYPALDDCERGAHDKPLSRFPSTCGRQLVLAHMPYRLLAGLGDRDIEVSRR